MVTLRTKMLENFIMFNENKCDKNLTSKNFKNIKTLDLNPIDIDMQYNKVYLEDLEYFANLKYLTISNMHIDIASFAYILRLQSLISLTFISCTFQDLSILSNFKLTHIGFINCEIENLGIINRVKGLKELTLIGYKNIDLSYFLNLNLSFFELTNSIVKNENDLKAFDTLIILKINKTNIMNLEFIIKLKKLKELHISNTQYSANKRIVDSLRNKIHIFIDNNILINKGEVK